MGGSARRPRDRSRPRRERALHAHPRRARRDAALRPARGGARIRLARAADPGPRGARARLQDARRRHRGAQPRAGQPGDRRVAARRREQARVPHVPVRGRRLRRGGGDRGAPGLRERHDRALPALPRGGHALDHRRHARPDHARDPREPRGVRLPGAARARDRAAHRHPARAHGRAQRGALDRRARAHPHGVLDGRGEAARDREGARPPAHEGRPHRDRRVHAGDGPAQRLGDRRRGGRAGSRAEAQGAEPAHGAARDPPGTRGREQRRGRARREEAATVPLPHARRVRGPRPAQGGGHDARASACAASRPGSPLAPTTWR